MHNTIIRIISLWVENNVFKELGYNVDVEFVRPTHLPLLSSMPLVNVK